MKCIIKMHYRSLVLFIRAIWLAYRIWHLYESNNEFVRMTVERQTNGGILSSIFGDKASVLKQLPDDGLSEETVTQIIVDAIED